MFQRLFQRFSAGFSHTCVVEGIVLFVKHRRHLLRVTKRTEYFLVHFLEHKAIEIAAAEAETCRVVENVGILWCGHRKVTWV